MAGFHTRIRFSKYDFKDSQFTVNLAAGITSASIGLAVTQDTSADNQVKLAGNGDEIIGILYTVEDRINEGELVGTVEFRFAAQLKIKSGLSGAQVVARGSRICGAGAGEVRAIDPATEAAKLPGSPRVWEVVGTNAVATLIV